MENKSLGRNLRPLEHSKIRDKNLKATISMTLTKTIKTMMRTQQDQKSHEKNIEIMLLKHIVHELMSTIEE